MIADADHEPRFFFANEANADNSVTRGSDELNPTGAPRPCESSPMRSRK
jgi:hypothetical protein